MSTFGLIHGARSDSTHWRFLVPELEQRGHRVLLVDLPMSDPKADQIAYADAAEAAFANAGEPIIAVGHSMGSAVAVQLEDRIPLAGMILLTPAIFYSPEQAPDQPPPLLANPTARVPTDEGLLVLPRDVTYDAYHDCPPDIIEWALDVLKPQGVAGMTAPFEFRPIRVPSALIRASEDRTVSPDWQEWAALALTGAPAIAIPGSHSPFLARPAFLADQFHTLAKDFASRN